MSEKKELKKEELEKVNGGKNVQFTCPHCNEKYWSYDLICENLTLLCPHCRGIISHLGH